MTQKNIALSKTNLIICGIAILLIIAGFLLMTGPSTTLENGFEPDIFSARRIKVAPVVTVAGFTLMIVGVLYPSRDKKAEK
ncbi:MAG: DUF3098 domain-containing protein [Bacteroidales bacterium]|jgi:uncharacterized membrane protein|nr:DUF3098 domain-containing protein [Bacteroidales bacterium]